MDEKHFEAETWVQIPVMPPYQVCDWKQVTASELGNPYRVSIHIPSEPTTHVRR